MELEQVKKIVEAALMVAASPVNFDRLAQLFKEDGDAAPSRDQLRLALEELENDYLHCGIELAKVASGYRFQARAEVSDWIGRLWDEKRPRYSRALLETLAIIAYRQPITRGEIENIRGVAVSTNIVRTLIEREWVRIVGHRDVPGKPAVYATTKQFLDYFNLASLEDLPSLAELKDIDDLNADLFANADNGEGDLGPNEPQANEAIVAGSDESPSEAEEDTIEAGDAHFEDEEVAIDATDDTEVPDDETSDAEDSGEDADGDDVASSATNDDDSTEDGEQPIDPVASAGNG